MALTRHCPACAGERNFDQPPCADGHGQDCPEWACTGCGTAILIGDAPEIPVIVRFLAA